MAVIDDTNDQQSSLIEDTLKKQAQKKANEQLKKHGSKAGKKTVKTTAKSVKAISKLLAKIFAPIFSFFGGILTPVICFMLITVMIVTTFFNAFYVEQYKQECPELVRVFLQDNFDKFEEKVNMYCHDEAFISFVCDSEFDNGYTKLVYGGTNAYTQDELKGNYIGVQGQSANWVTKNGEKYSAKSVLETVQDYLDAGVDVSKIKINDEYLKGYGEASGYGNKDSLSFDKWINYSYYTIPFYYHWNMAKNSQYESPSVFLGYTYSGDSHGLPSWLNDDEGYWGFMDYANTEGKTYDGLPDLYTKVFFDAPGDDINYTNMTYKDYLNTGWMSYKPTYNNAAAIPSDSKLSDDYEDGSGYYAKGVMIGYKMNKEDWLLEKVIDKLYGKDQLYNYHPFSKYYMARGGGFYDAVTSNLYLYDWFEKKSGKETNYEKYIMNPTDISTISKREQSNGMSMVNSNIEVWINSFAEYFAKEIYYIYPNRDYIVDYFMSDDIDKDKKIAFLQRSFYAMATGSELDLVLDEEYTINNGTVGSVLNDTVCGSLNIKDLSISKMELCGYYDWDVYTDNTEPKMETTDIANVQLRINEVLEQQHTSLSQAGMDEDELNEQIFSIDVLYNATIRLQYNDGQEDVYFKIPITNRLTYSIGTKQITETSLTFNIENAPKIFANQMISKSKSAKYLSKLVKFDWNEDYYNAQYNYQDDSDEKGTNPLDGLENNIVFENYQTQDWDNFSFTKLSADDLQQELNSFCSGDKNPLYNMFTGSMKGNRSINFQYSDHSFLNYDVNEIKDSDGNIKKVSIQIYTYYPDISKYGEDEYRVAYGFENGEAINEALNLLHYLKDHEGDTNKLTDLSDKVDFSSLIISSDGTYADTGAVYEDSDLYQYIADIIFKVESSGNWGAIAKPYNVTSSETTITVGAYQFFGERGHKLLKAICKQNSKDAKSIIGQTVYDYIVSDTNWENTSFGTHGELSDSDYSNLSKLLKTDYGIKCQKEEMAHSIKEYIKIAKSKGVTDIKCQAYFCIMYHQSPKQTYYVVDEWNILSSKTLETFHSTCLQNDVFSDYPSRYKTTYEMCKEIVTMSVSGDMAKVLQYVQSSKVIGKKYGRSDIYSSQKYKPTYDCSELIYCAFYYGAGLVLPTTAATQEEWCSTNATLICQDNQNLDVMKPGDLIFYADENSSTAKGDHNVCHVAIYIGNGLLVEAGDPVGVYSATSDWHTERYFATYRITLNN